MTRIILFRVGELPQVTRLSTDEALQGALNVPVACLALYGGVKLWCNRDGLLCGLTLRRAQRGANHVATVPRSPTAPRCVCRTEPVVLPSVINTRNALVFVATHAIAVVGTQRAVN
jgi:hypothetical protein